MATGSQGTANGYWLNTSINFWSFYDLPLSLYSLYWRTGDPTYLTWAQQAADINWAWMLDHGAGISDPRNLSIVSQFLRALEVQQAGGPDRFAGIYTVIAYLQNNLHTDNPGASPNWDTREAGYTHRFTALGAKLDPNPTRHGQYCSWLTSLTPGWNSALTAQGYWQENVFQNNPTYPSGPLTYSPLQFGASPWRMNLAILGLEDAYEVLNDTSSAGCNQTALAAATLTTITKAVTFVHDYGRSSVNRGIFYDAENASDSNRTFSVAGTMSVSVSGTTVTGSSTTFTSGTAGGGFSCNGNEYVGFVASRTVYQVTACADATHLTISPAYGAMGEVSGLSGSTATGTRISSTSCGASLATYCNNEVDQPNPAPSGDRDLNRLAAGAVGWLYHQTGNASYKAWGDEWFSASFGGPGVGPTSNSLIGQSDTSSRCAGTDCDSYITEYIGSLWNCGAHAPPCYNNASGAYAALGKNFNEADGAARANKYLADRLGGHAAPISRTFHIGVHLLAAATKAVPSIRQADGATYSATCLGTGGTSIDCAVEIPNAEEGAGMLIISQYNGSALIAAGEAAPFTFQ